MFFPKVTNLIYILDLYHLNPDYILTIWIRLYPWSTIYMAYAFHYSVYLGILVTCSVSKCSFPIRGAGDAEAYFSGDRARGKNTQWAGCQSIVEHTYHSLTHPYPGAI